MRREVGRAIELEVSGRLCLFGEHSDWAGGYRSSHPELSRGLCLVAGTDQGIAARAEPLDGRIALSSVLPGGDVRGPVEWVGETAALEAAAAEGGFFSYAAGVAAEVLRAYPAGGLRVEGLRSDLPIGKGLSSSAAVCVLVARAFNRAYDLSLSVRDEMELAYRGERRTGSECGRMDQVCALGRSPSLLTFDGEGFGIEPVRPGGTFWLLVVDLGGTKDTRKILRDLNRCFPDAPGELAAGVRDALGHRNAELVRRARHAIDVGDVGELGALMTEAQAIFDRMVAPACPELRAPRLHHVLAHPAVADLSFGGKGVGSQGDGCAQLVARGPDERARLAETLESSLGVTCLPLTIRPT
jgi:mevalonate kinase